jgi:enterochelin esterase-like enzyme
LLAKGLNPPTVAVLIESINAEVRLRELTCYLPFDDFLIKEILPWVHQNYHVTSEPSQIMVGGASFGGFAATCVALRHPEVFGKRGSFCAT